MLTTSLGTYIMGGIMLFSGILALWRAPDFLSPGIKNQADHKKYRQVRVYGILLIFCGLLFIVGEWIMTSL